MRKPLFFMCGTLLALALALTVLLSLTKDTMTLYVEPPGTGYSDVTVEFSNPGILECVGTGFVRGQLQIKLKSLQPGITELYAVCEHPDPDLGFAQRFYDITVKPGGMIVIGQQFSGWEWLIYGVWFYFLLLFLYFLRYFRRLRRTSLFDYRTMFVHALMLSQLAGTMIFGLLSLLLLCNPGIYSAEAVFYHLRQMTAVLLVVLLPLARVFAISVSISNVALMRHEGVRPINMLGLFSGAALLLATLSALFVTAFDQDWSTGTITGMTVNTVVSVSVLFGEAMLWSVIACALMGLKTKHSYDQDYILILGCSIRQDGTLYPLIRGRVDAALDFYRKQLEATGKAPILVPSGGKGDDEPIAEAEAMGRYLLEQGVPAEHILLEDRSTTTYENMLFSKKLIEERTKDAKVLFATTNYHVFRSGMIARQAGLQAGGIGARTKWYFWPNAFLREFVGILVRYWKPEAVILLVIILQTVLLASLGGMIAGL